MYADLGLGLSPINPAVAVVPLDASGLPTGPAEVLYAAGFAPDDSDRVAVVRSYLSSAGWTPDGEQIYATMEASRALAVLSPDLSAAAEMDGGFLQVPRAFVKTGEGPRGVAFTDGQAWVHSFLDRSVSGHSVAELAEALPASAEEPTSIDSTVSITLADSDLDPSVALGRSYFYSATNPLIVEASAGASCSTCHFEGRTDSVTWPTVSGVRQVPSLAGRVSDTLPLTWTENVATVEDEARITSQERLGGHGATDADLEAIAAYIDFIREVDNPDRGSTSADVVAGRALFERPDVGCAVCHSGERYTDRESHELFGLDAVDTPTLTGVAATAPYFHDGRAATLRDVLDSAVNGEMGDASMLSEAELREIEAFLRSL
jgi:cytochrome c